MADAIEQWNLSGYFPQAERIDVHRSAGGWATTILHECSVDDLSRLAEEFGATHATPVFFSAAAQLLDRPCPSVWIVAAEPDWISYGLWSNDRWERLCQRRSEDDSPDSIIAFLNQEAESGGVEENGSRLVRVWSDHHAPGTVSKGQWQLEYQRPYISIEPA
ncbi:MAG: hypothetical protein M9951_10295 [Burkholderiaceae bacterium]|nr:hypothetical protein [Burkholderiaceae bacterium]